MTTNTIIRKSTTSTTGYELVIVQNGQETVHLLNDRPKNEPHTLILPENPSNRKYFNDQKVDKAGGQIELTYKETRTIGPKDPTKTPTPKTPNKSLIDYLTEDERTIYDDLMKKAAKRAERERLLKIIEETTRAIEEMGEEA
jgi:hypothetical protein